MKKTVGLSKFVMRQRKDSIFTHYSKTWSELINITEEQFQLNNFTKGYRDGVIIVHIPSIVTRFFYTFSNFPMFEGMKLKAEYKRVEGREHEPAKVCISIEETKQSCNYVDVILYRSDVIEEDGERNTMCNWEIVSINGRLNKEPVPMSSLTIVRNWKHLVGGTEMKGAKPKDVLESLCQSILYENGIKND